MIIIDNKGTVVDEKFIYLLSKDKDNKNLINMYFKDQMMSICYDSETQRDQWFARLSKYLKADKLPM